MSVVCFCSDLWILKTSHWDQAAKDMGLGQEAAVEGQGPWVLVLDHQQLLLRPLLPQLKLIDLLATGEVYLTVFMCYLLLSFSKNC